MEASVSQVPLGLTFAPPGISHEEFNGLLKIFFNWINRLQDRNVQELLLNRLPTLLKI
jgi:hypothetical protein